MMFMPDKANNGERFFQRWPLVLAGSVFIWGSLIALGAYLRYREPGKPLVIFGSTVIFALIWLAVSRAQRRR